MDDGSKGKLKDEAVSVNKSSSLKRPRQRSMNGTQIASCLVDGCNADLSKCRDYYRRHKVCELHSKTSKVTINGEERRFCQQCSRFHSLGEFDEGKRSCRRRLDGHNKRRRKPQVEPISTNVGRFLSSYQGTILCPTNYARGGAVKPENYAAVESNGALSLLSLTPVAAAANQEDIGLSHKRHSSAIGPGPSQSLIPRLPYNELGLMDEAAVSNFMTDGSSSASLLQCQGMFQNSDYAS